MESGNTNGYITDPKSIEDHVHNAEFQLSNVVAGMSSKNYDYTLIKAECLILALKQILEQLPEKNKSL